LGDDQIIMKKILFILFIFISLSINAQIDLSLSIKTTKTDKNQTIKLNFIDYQLTGGISSSFNCYSYLLFIIDENNVKLKWYKGNNEWIDEIYEIVNVGDSVYDLTSIGGGINTKDILLLNKDGFALLRYSKKGIYSLSLLYNDKRDMYDYILWYKTSYNKLTLKRKTIKPKYIKKHESKN